MGCGPSKAASVPPDLGHPPPYNARKAPLTAQQQQQLQELTVRLLEALAATRERVALPVLPTEQRLTSGQRGISRIGLAGLRAFFERVDAMDKVMQDVVNEAGFNESACELCKSTGLSLAETLVREADGAAGFDGVIGPATSFFSYSWTGTKLRDMLDAIERALATLEQDGTPRFVWVRRAPRARQRSRYPYAPWPRVAPPPHRLCSPNLRRRARARWTPSATPQRALSMCACVCVCVRRSTSSARRSRCCRA